MHDTWLSRFKKISVLLFIGCILQPLSAQLVSTLYDDILHRTLESVLLEHSQQSLRASAALHRQLTPSIRKTRSIIYRKKEKRGKMKVEQNSEI